MYETILLPTDGSRDIDAVAEHAMTVASLADATIHAVYVIEGGKARGAHPDDETVEEARAAGEAAVGEIEALGEKRGVTVTTAVLEGSAAEAILDYADRVGVDMIVMGTHGRSGLDRFLVGSVAERVIRMSDVPVMTVRLTDGDRAVSDAETAQAVARDVLKNDGYEVAEFPDDPYRETGTWIVRAETTDGSVFNVHIDAASGDARLARIE
ncbi:MAG TPA: universal stress protein [Natrialbaceae archaeon]|nr:universal stress protein [Natrialbaceae archaeon]